MPKLKWMDYATERGIHPLAACDLILDVSETLTDENLHLADDMFRAAVEKYLSENSNP